MILDVSTLVPAFTFLLYVAFLIFGLLTNRSERTGRPFLFYMGAMTIWSLGSMLMHANINLLTPLIWNRVMIVGLFAIPIVFFYAMVNLTSSHNRYRGLLLTIGLIIYGFMLILNFFGLIVTEAGFEGTEFYYTLGPYSPLAYILGITYLGMAIVVLSREIRSATDPITRKKFTPLLIGAILLIIGQLANINVAIGRYPIDLAAAALNGLLIFYSIYKYRLVNYSQTVLKVFVYFFLLVILSFLFTAVLWIVLPPLRLIDFQERFLFSIILSLIASVVFQPLRRGAIWTLGQLYSGRRLSYYESLKAFSETLASLVDLDTLVEATTEKISSTFEPTWVAMFVLDYSDRNYRLVSQLGLDIPAAAGSSVFISGDHPCWNSCSDTNGVTNLRDQERTPLRLPDTEIELYPRLVLPLKFRERTNGFIVLGRLQGKEYYDQHALETLGIFAGQCSIALENAISFERLRKQQKRLQEMNEELTISRNKLEAFFDGITAPISLQDIDYNIVLVNSAAARFFQIPVSEMPGKKCYQVYFDRDKPCSGCLAQDCLHTQLSFTKEMNHESTHTIFSVHYYPIAVPDGSPKLFLEFFHDVTEQKRLREELVQSAKLAGIGTLASGIAHEINNPLAAISATAEVILEVPGLNSLVREYSEDILKCARDAALIINDLNTYSRKDPAEPSDVDVVEAINSTLKLALRGLDTDGITVRTNYEVIPSVAGNINELRQVFLNLIVNSVQAMHGEGTLTIDVAVENGNAVIEISDTGEGITPDLINQVFNPFFTTKEPGVGTGLGLSIVHQIIYRHGGRITADSIPGELTTMRILLPLADTAPPTIRFVQARTRDELEDVFFIQRKILVGEKGYREETIHRPTDAHGFHIVAYKGLQPIGTVTCVLDSDTGQLPIAAHLDENDPLLNSGKMAEIDRLAVVPEERGGLAPLGLMMLAYLYGRTRDAKLVFLDIFADDKQQLKLYNKVGFEEICRYYDPLEVTVMVLRHRLNYETDTRRLNSFLRPLMARLIPRMNFNPDIEAAILQHVENINQGLTDID